MRTPDRPPDTCARTDGSSHSRSGGLRTHREWKAQSPDAAGPEAGRWCTWSTVSGSRAEHRADGRTASALAGCSRGTDVPAGTAVVIIVHEVDPASVSAPRIGAYTGPAVAGFPYTADVSATAAVAHIDENIDACVAPHRRRAIVHGNKSRRRSVEADALPVRADSASTHSFSGWTYAPATPAVHGITLSIGTTTSAQCIHPNIEAAAPASDAVHGAGAGATAPTAVPRILLGVHAAVSADDPPRKCADASPHLTGRFERAPNPTAAAVRVAGERVFAAIPTECMTWSRAHAAPGLAGGTLGTPSATRPAVQAVGLMHGRIEAVRRP